MANVHYTFSFFSPMRDNLSNPFVVSCHNCLVFSHPLQILTCIAARKLVACNAASVVINFISNICEESIKCVSAVEAVDKRFFLGRDGVRFELTKLPIIKSNFNHFGEQTAML